MNVFATEYLEVDTTETRDDATPKTPTAPVQPQHTQPTLSEQQDAFLRDRFTTKLEDPRTGRWIRAWREEGIAP